MHEEPAPERAGRDLRPASERSRPMQEPPDYHFFSNWRKITKMLKIIKKIKNGTGLGAAQERPGSGPGAAWEQAGSGREGEKNRFLLKFLSKSNDFDRPGWPGAAGTEKSIDFH